MCEISRQLDKSQLSNIIKSLLWPCVWIQIKNILTCPFIIHPHTKNSYPMLFLYKVIGQRRGKNRTEVDSIAPYVAPSVTVVAKKIGWKHPCIWFSTKSYTFVATDHWSLPAALAIVTKSSSNIFSGLSKSKSSSSPATTSGSHSSLGPDKKKYTYYTTIITHF